MASNKNRQKFNLPKPVSGWDTRKMNEWNERSKNSMRAIIDKYSNKPKKVPLKG